MNINTVAATQHSEFNRCSDNLSCGKCFNNLTDTRGFTLMLTPKVATQSIIEMYKQSSPYQIRWSSKHWVEHYAKSHFIIGFIRNPFDRLVSCWKDKTINQHHRTWDAYGIKHGSDFETFVRIITEVPHHEADKHWRSQSFDLYTATGRAIPHAVVRFENLAQEWIAAAAQLRLATAVNLGPLPHRHASGHKPFLEYYTPDLVERVGNYFHDDLVNFNYCFASQPDLHMAAAAV